MLLAVGLLAVGCTSSDKGQTGATPGTDEAPALAAGEAPKRTWVASIPDTDAFVAIVSSSSQLIAYVCDNGTVADWFLADSPAKEVALTAGSGDRLHLTFDGDTVHGTHTRTTDDTIEAHDFDARATDQQVMFRGEDAQGDYSVLAGWIQKGDEQRGAVSGTVKLTGPATATGTATPTTTRTVTTVPKINPGSLTGVPIAPIVTTTTKASTTTTTTRPVNPVPVTLPSLPTLTVLPKPITPDTIGAPTPGKPLRYVIATMGDSYASGEGAPVHAAKIDDHFTRLDRADWGKAADDAEQQDKRSCHRSDYAGSQVAVNGKFDDSGAVVFQGLAQKYPGVDFRFKSFACSGAQTNDLISDTYVGPDKDDRKPQDPQIKQLTDWVGVGPDAQFDALYMSAGGNNSLFGDVVTACLADGLGRSIAQLLSNMTGTPWTDIGDFLRVDNVAGPDSNVIISATGPNAPPPVTISVPDALGAALAFGAPCDEDQTLATDVAQGRRVNGSATQREPGTGINALPADYDTLNDAIGKMPVPPHDVLLSEYPDPSRPTTAPTPQCGGFSRGTADDILGLVDNIESPWTITTLLAGLNGGVDIGVTNENARKDATHPSVWHLVKDHVDEFRQAHGICADDPWVNDNIAALTVQGDDLNQPDLRNAMKAIDGFLSNPVSGTIIVALATVIGFAVGATVAAPAGAAGGTLGALAGFSLGVALTKIRTDNAINLSAGMMHPNAKGHESYARAILAQLDPLVQAKLTPQAPDRVRQTAAVANGQMTIRWDDKSDKEQNYKITGRKIRGAGPDTITQIRPNDTQSFVFDPGGAALYELSVQACNVVACSAPVTVRVTNQPPLSDPAGVAGSFSTFTDRNGVTDDELVVTWNAGVPDNAQTYKVQVALQPATTSTTAGTPAASGVFEVTGNAFRLRLGGANRFPLGTYKVSVQACNVLGCSPGTAPLTVDATSHSKAKPGSEIKQELPPNVFVDVGVRIGAPVPGTPTPTAPGPTGPTGPGPGPGPGPDPAPPGGGG